MSECEYALTDVPAGYLRGKLDDDAAEAFEAHYFACDRCWNELETSMVVRGRAMPARAKAARRPFVIPMSIAAAAVLIMISAWVLLPNRRPDDVRVMRGGTPDAIAVSVIAQGPEAVLRWNAVPNASSYAVTVFDAEGTELQRIPAASTTVALQQPRRAFVRVEALDSAGNAIATSSLQPLDTTK